MRCAASRSSVASRSSTVTRKAHEDVDRLVADRQPATFLEAERLVESDRAVDFRDAVARVDELHRRAILTVLEILLHEPVEHAVHPLAVPPERLAPNAIADKARALGVRDRALVEAVDLEL